jgi:type VI secretion system protein ImpE
MTAEQSLRDGDLTEALAQLQQEVRQDPANAESRTFLFQLLSVLGDWDRAMTQLNVCGELDAGRLAMVQTYREALQCEVLREQIFAGKKAPLIFGKPGQWVALLIEAVKLTAAGHHEQAQAMRAEALEAASTTSGTIDGQPFEWIADADMRLGPMLEAIVNGRYYWVPFDHIRTINIEEPADLRDRVWMPAYFTWSNGGETVGLIPTRYPGSNLSDDPQIRLAAKTEWREMPAETYLGEGQRLLATDGGEFPLMDIRAIELETEETDQAADGAVDREAEQSDG